MHSIAEFVTHSETDTPGHGFNVRSSKSFYVILFIETAESAQFLQLLSMLQEDRYWVRARNSSLLSMDGKNV